MNIDCCELALYNGQLALKIALGAFVLIAFLLAMIFGYNLKLKDKNIELSKRTEVLEKKNGKELAELEKVKKRLDKIEGGKHE